MNASAAATPLLDDFCQRGIFVAAPLTLIDAGCRGGIGSVWRRFAPHLVAHGFDPLIDECERLSRAERLESVHYHARYLGLPDDDPFLAHRRDSARSNSNPWSRLSTARAADILAAHSPGTVERLAEPATRIGITEFVRENRVGPIDFLKIDVDGDDYAVLRSAAGIMDDVLGMSIEVNYFGSDDDTDNTFHNIDRYVRAMGFDLFAVNSRLYSHAALPAPFAGRGPGATTFGRPLQGHALYLRDLAAPHRREAARALDVPALAKLAALFELFRLPDCAAELIETFGERFAEIGAPGQLLDAIASGVGELPYREYVRRFERDPLAGANKATPRPDQNLVTLRVRYADVRKKLRSCRDRSVALTRQNAGLRARIDALESSLVWRLTAPWRRLRERRP